MCARECGARGAQIVRDAPPALYAHVTGTFEHCTPRSVPPSLLQTPFPFPKFQNSRQAGVMVARHRGYGWGGVLLKVVAIGMERSCALIEPSNVCQDKVATDVLFDTGFFHTCGATGMLTGSQTTDDYRRKITCWGWGDFGQLDPPDIDHVTSVTAGARHSCATNRARLPSCWGSNLYGQADLPRPLFEKQKIYCKVGDYIDTANSRVRGMCEDKVTSVLTLKSKCAACKHPVHNTFISHPMLIIPHTAQS